MNEGLTVGLEEAMSVKVTEPPGIQSNPTCLVRPSFLTALVGRLDTLEWPPSPREPFIKHKFTNRRSQDEERPEAPGADACSIC